MITLIVVVLLVLILAVALAALRSKKAPEEKKPDEIYILNQALCQRRDALVDAIFKSPGLPLLHVPAQATYNVSEVRAKILALFS